MKLWIDDLRDAPDDTWKVARSSDEAVLHLLAHANSPIDEVSFDHDLGGDDTTRPVMLWMIENDVWPDHIHAHTANPVGRDWIVGMAKRYSPAATTVSI